MDSTFNWREIPFVRLIIPYLFGLGLALYLDDTIGALPLLLLALFIPLVLLGILKIKYRLRWWYGPLLYFFLFGFGYQMGSQENELLDGNHFQKYIGQENTILAVVDNFPKAGKKIKLRGKVQALYHSNKWLSTSGNLLMYLEPSMETTDVQYGDQLLIKASIQPIPPPSNPEAFNFQKYQHFQNTHYQLFAKQDSWKIAQRKGGSWWIAKAFSIRQHFQEVLRKHLTTKAEFGVATALILGNKNPLTSEIQSAYASTGATHVLAVSGLHVGFIYLGLAFLLSFLNRRGRMGKAIKTILLIAGVWSFAFITGAPPSVLRAATMFTFIIIGRTMDRPTNIYNTLALSAFVLLCINPYLLAEVGFQLSYLAILGIVSFQPWLYRLWIIDHPIGDHIWKLMSVGIAAQITTFPITIFYFHQFPIYFWLSGLVVVPAAMLILGGGLLLFILDLILPFLANLIGVLLYQVIWMTNAIIYFIQQLPNALIQGLWLEPGGLVLLYFCILLLTYIFIVKRRVGAFAVLSCVAVFLLVSTWQNYSRWQQREMVFYFTNRNSLVDLIDRTKLSVFVSEGLEEEAINYAAQNYRWKSGIKDQEIFSFATTEKQMENWWFNDGFLQFFETRIFFLDDTFHIPPDKQLAIDYLIIRNNPDLDIEVLKNTFPNATWIADGSNPPWILAKWQQECERAGIDFKNLFTEGGQIVQLK